MNSGKYKKILLEEKNKITSLISEMQDNTVFGNTTEHTSEKYTTSELSSYDNHPADIGTDLYMQDMQSSLTTHEKSRLTEIDSALYKIENGTYGVCEQCKNKIDEDRLEILPETNLCSNCAKEQLNPSETSTNFDHISQREAPRMYDLVIQELDEMNIIPKDDFDAE